MQLQWLRYVSICRPVERHQFIIIALNRPAPCTPTPSHSILPSIVQFRFYAVIALFSHRLRHFSSLLPLSFQTFEFPDSLALLLFSLFFSFLPLPSILRDISTLSHVVYCTPTLLYFSLHFLRTKILFSSVPLTLSLHRSLSPPIHLLLAMAHHPCFLRRFADRDIHELKKKDIEKRSGRN